ncbi:MAG: hypothetical protein A3K19_16665 [Lentisphaerae bacterium RIFOXYB12_FULL_65_16]|nr:MAG: hypothetical protein A3K18_20425 [Lentisphaerae bacterium RIFOXYA12_64_32]OGV89074.1 MAG: hypothetical protein A3K19_16665 [Lentisphaerae bacterium RIFOXYB12_FULL_65_16]
MTKAPRIPVAYPDTKLPLVSVSKSDTNARSGTYHLHTDVDWEIWFIAAGQVCLRVSGRPWRLRAGQLLVVGPDEPHALVSGSGKWYTLIFRQRLLQGLPCQARGVTKTALDVAGTRLSGKLTLGARQGANLDYLLDRLERGHLLSDSIRDLDGLRPAPVTPGSEHGYWSYGMCVDAWEAKTFAAALGKEGVPCGAGYIGEPIYMCMEACCNKVTFGTSQHPFDGCHTSRKYEYIQGMCPRTEEALKCMVTLGIHEFMVRQDALDMAGAIRKVAEVLPKTVATP